LRCIGSIAPWRPSKNEPPVDFAECRIVTEDGRSVAKRLMENTTAATELGTGTAT
jgi:hypothetical protein